MTPHRGFNRPAPDRFNIKLAKGKQSINVKGSLADPCFPAQVSRFQASLVLLQNVDDRSFLKKLVEDGLSFDSR